MDWVLHHVNVPAHNVKETASFLRDVIGLPDGQWIYPEQAGQLHHDDNSIAYFGIENRGLHVVRSIPTFALDNGFAHNPTIGGHFALSVPDIEDVMRRLDQANVLYSDAGVYAMAGVHQIYCYDPSFNVIEINQVKTPLTHDARTTQFAASDVALHHVAIPAHDVLQSAAFFSDLIGLGDFSTVDSKALAWFQSGKHGLRLIKPSVTYARQHNLLHNPTLEAYFALTVPDLSSVIGRMSAAKIDFTELHADPLGSSERILTYSPSMRLVALYQA